MAYFGEDMDLDPYEDEFNINLGLFPDVFGAGRRALDSLPGILAGIYARGRELSSNAGGYEDEDGDRIADGIYGGQGGLQGSPVNIVKRNEAGEQIGIIPGVRIGYGDNARVVTLDELASINEARKRAGQSTIVTGTPGFVPVFVDESGATVSNETSNVRTPSTTTAASSTSARPTTPTPSIYDLGGGGGGGKVPITLPGGRTILIPEGLNPLQLLTQGYITREIYKQETGEDAPDVTQPNQTAEPAELVQETGDPLRRTTDTVVPGDTGPGDTETIDPITNIQQPVSGTDISEVSDLSGGGLRKDMNEEEEIIDDGIDDGIGPGDGTDTGPGDATGSGEGFDYEKFFQMLGAIPAFQSGASFEEGEVPGIYPTAIQSLPQASAFIQSILELDRPVSEQQAQLKTDIYGNIIEDVREAQSPLMQSLARRSEMQGLEAERLMGPLSFLEGRDATQAGYGQAVAGGRGLGNISEMLAGRQRAEQKNVNLQLASNLLGQQRATAGLMADIESGIYGRMAPDIGVDPGTILGIAGTDIQNVLGEKLGREYSEAIREGSRREQQGRLLETAVGFIPDNPLKSITDLINFINPNKNKPVYADTANV